MWLCVFPILNITRIVWPTGSQPSLWSAIMTCAPSTSTPFLRSSHGRWPPIVMLNGAVTPWPIAFPTPWIWMDYYGFQCNIQWNLQLLHRFPTSCYTIWQCPWTACHVAQGSGWQPARNPQRVTAPYLGTIFMQRCQRNSHGTLALQTPAAKMLFTTYHALLGPKTRSISCQSSPPKTARNSEFIEARVDPQYACHRFQRLFASETTYP